jgi:hypothetical protein
MVKLILYNKEATVEKTAILYMKYVYCNYRLPVLIVQTKTHDLIQNSRKYCENSQE